MHLSEHTMLGETPLCQLLGSFGPAPKCQQTPWATQADPTTRPKRPKGLKDLTDQTLKIFSDFGDPPDPIFGPCLVGFLDEKQIKQFRNVGDTNNQKNRNDAQPEFDYLYNGFAMFSHIAIEDASAKK